MLKSALAKLTQHNIVRLITDNARLRDENTHLKRRNHELERNDRRTLDLLAQKNVEIQALQEQLRGRDRKIADYRRDREGRFA